MNFERFNVCEFHDVDAFMCFGRWEGIKHQFWYSLTSKKYLILLENFVTFFSIIQVAWLKAIIPAKEHSALKWVTLSIRLKTYNLKCNFENQKYPTNSHQSIRPMVEAHILSQPKFLAFRTVNKCLCVLLRMLI